MVAEIVDPRDLAEAMQGHFRFFAGLDSEEVVAFLGFCRRRQAAAGELLWQEGDPDNYAAFIVSGQIGIKKRQSEFGREQIFVGTYGPGSVAGELCLLTDNARAVTAEVLEPADLVLMSGSSFDELSVAHPDLGLKLLRHIFQTTCGRLRKSYERIASIF